MTRSLVLLGVCLAAGVASLAYMAVAPANRGDLDAQTRAVASTLKCPVCHDLSVADSPAPVAGEMRAEIRSRLQAGESPDQIRQEFVQAYGPSILLTPAARGFDLSLWAAPLSLALAGLALVVAALRRWTRKVPSSREAASGLGKRDREILERALARLSSE